MDVAMPRRVVESNKPVISDLERRAAQREEFKEAAFAAIKECGLVCIERGPGFVLNLRDALKVTGVNRDLLWILVRELITERRVTADDVTVKVPHYGSLAEPTIVTVKQMILSIA